SQDPTGPVGADNSFNIYFPAHIGYLPSASAPFVAAPCGTNPVVTGTDFTGVVQEGSGSVSACGITFRRAFRDTPSCHVTYFVSGVSRIAFSVSTAVFQFTKTATGGQSIFAYVCTGN